MRILAVVVVALVSMAAFPMCSNSNVLEDRSSPNVQSSSSRPDSGVFRRLWQDPPTLAPHQVTDTNSAAIAVELFSGLVSINLDLQLEPDLAESWEVSQDGLTYTFHMRPNAKFHDGKTVTAHDVKYSLELSLIHI